MRKLTLALSAAALGVGGIAYAAPGMMRGGDMTRAEAQEHVAEMFAWMDANEDGVLNKADREAHRNKIFDLLDINKDGVLNREEFASHEGRVHRRGSGPDGEAGPGLHHFGRGHGGEWLMQKADADGDGSISQAEFTATHLARFDKADANGNGTVTRKERRAAFKAKRDEWREFDADEAGE